MTLDIESKWALITGASRGSAQSYDVCCTGFYRHQVAISLV